MAKRKMDAKAFAQNKRRRRRMLTFLRMVRYGVNNFSRNSWLTIAATAVMSITLLVILATFIAQNVLSDTIATIRDKVDMTVYAKSDAKQADVDKIVAKLQGLDSVRRVSVVTPSQQRQQFIEKNKADAKTLDALNQADAQFSWAIRANLEDINDTSELQHFVDTDADMKRIIDPAAPPSFAGPERKAIESIGGWVNFANKAGLIAGSVFVVISSLIVFNTIRMAIFNRREEIQMMKLIGAERSFIRGPFVVEAIMYGFIAAIVATGLGGLLLYLARDPLTQRGVSVGPTMDMLILYSPFVLLAMILIGSVIGVVSSLFATHKYLKI